MRPVELKPGDVILYRNNGWLGSAISWGQWRGTSKEALEYSHIGVVYDFIRSFEMNPPAARLFSLNEVPWDRVDVWRVSVDGANPFDQAAVVAAFQKACDSRVGEKYNYGYIASLLGMGLLSRVGLGGVSRWLLGKANPAPAMHRDICSTCADEVLTAGISLIKPDFDFFDDLGPDQAAPSDYPRSKYLVRVEG